ncbi:hypothetical protein C0993_007570 [Termitomyces sp. T159_Od127]|nr:hypothetical protein C0993_007570 [Termitomyces sp. T159_Od127]
MVWPLTLRRAVLLKKTIHAPDETVLALLHDPNVLFSLSPFVAKATPDLDSPNSYTFTEALSFAGIITYNATSRCLFEPLENGVDCTVVAGFGTRLKVCYRVKRLQDQETEVSEDSIVESAFLTLPYVLKTFTFAHKSILEALAAKAEDHPDVDQQ